MYLDDISILGDDNKGVQELNYVEYICLGRGVFQEWLDGAWDQGKEWVFAGWIGRRGNFIPSFPKHLCCACSKDATIWGVLGGHSRKQGAGRGVEWKPKWLEIREYMNFMETLSRMNLDHSDRQTNLNVEFLWNLLCKVLLWLLEHRREGWCWLPNQANLESPSNHMGCLFHLGGSNRMRFYAAQIYKVGQNPSEGMLFMQAAHIILQSYLFKVPICVSALVLGLWFYWGWVGLLLDVWRRSYGLGEASKGIRD